MFVSTYLRIPFVLIVFSLVNGTAVDGFQDWDHSDAIDRLRREMEKDKERLRNEVRKQREEAEQAKVSC